MKFIVAILIIFLDLLYDQAIECRMTKLEYVRANLLVEYQAKIKQAEFYQTICHLSSGLKNI